MDKEIWKPIINYEGYYEISNYGNVRSVNRNVLSKDGKVKHLKGKDLKKILGLNGYYVVNLCKNHTGRTICIHRLVAEAFIQNPNGLNVINHKDGDKHNNYYENLEWTTLTGNMIHAWEKGLCCISKYTGGVRAVAKVDPISNEILEEYFSIAEAARQNKHKSASGISGVLAGKKKTSHGYKWIYIEGNMTNDKTR